MAGTWEAGTEEKFRQIIAKMPVFLRGMAEKAISLKAESLAAKDNRTLITEKDLVDALFLETPFGFQGLMKNDLTAIGVDYMKYGYSK